MKFGEELMKNDSIHRLFLKSFSNATIWVLDQFIRCSNWMWSRGSQTGVHWPIWRGTFIVQSQQISF